jgi:hypothetical protein
MENAGRERPASVTAYKEELSSFGFAAARGTRT